MSALKTLEENELDYFWNYYKNGKRIDFLFNDFKKCEKQYIKEISPNRVDIEKINEFAIKLKTNFKYKGKCYEATAIKTTKVRGNTFWECHIDGKLHNGHIFERLLDVTNGVGIIVEIILSEFIEHLYNQEKKA
jgi:hypothetical protein